MSFEALRMLIPHFSSERRPSEKEEICGQHGAASFVRGDRCGAFIRKHLRCCLSAGFAEDTVTSGGISHILVNLRCKLTNRVDLPVHTSFGRCDRTPNRNFPNTTARWHTNQARLWLGLGLEFWVGVVAAVTGSQT